MKKYKVINYYDVALFYQEQYWKTICHCETQADAANICSAMNFVEHQTLLYLEFKGD